MRKSFKNIHWRSASANKLKSDFQLETPEEITLKGNYSAEDLKRTKHIRFGAGRAPFLRGPYASMYTVRPRTIRQNAGFSTAEESNAFYRRNL